MKKVTQNIKSERGVTLVALVAMMIVIFTILSIVLYNGRASVRLEKLNDMYNDISVLEEKIQLYYIKNGTLPTSGDALNFSPGDSNPNDEENSYYKINLSLLGDVSLENSIDDYYVNSATLTVYSEPGYEYEGVTYHTIPRVYATLDLSEDASQEHNITLNYAGSTNQVEEITYTGKYTLPQSGTYLESYTTGYGYGKKTYYFNGWKGNDGKYYRYAYKGEPTSVTAQWSDSTNSITVHFLDGTTEIETRTYNIGDKFEDKYGELPQMTSSSGKRFIGWVNEAGDIITKDMLVNSKETYIYAKWEISSNASFVVIFNPLDGTVSPTTITVKNNSIYGNLPTPVPNNSKYRFEGWYTDTSFTNKITAETEVKLTGNITLYAKYVQYKYTVTFNYNRPDRVTESVTWDYANGEKYGTYNLDAGLPTHANVIYETWREEIEYKFLGWSSNRNATVPNITDDTLTVLDSDITVYGIWEEVTGSSGEDVRPFG